MKLALVLLGGYSWALVVCRAHLKERTQQSKHLAHTVVGVVVAARSVVVATAIAIIDATAISVVIDTDGVLSASASTLCSQMEI